MNALHAVMRGITRFNEKLGELVSYLVLVMFVLLLLEVGLRYIFRSPTVWTNELTQMLFGAYAIFAGAYIMAQSGHVNVDIVYARFSPRVKAGLDVVTSILFFLFVGVLIYQGGSMAYESVSRLEHSQSAWNPPLWPIKLTIPIAAVLLLVQGVVKLINDILILLGKPSPFPAATSLHEGPEDTL